MRLERRCLELPLRLRSLFQAEPRLRPLMGIALAASRGGGLDILWAVVSALWLTVSAGGAVGAVGALRLGWDGPATAMAAVFGVLLAVLLRLYVLVFVLLRRNDYGLCRGHSADASKPALTDWIHEALQDIAFGDAVGSHRPLTFGDLEKRGVTLRMMTTNLSLRRPHALPRMISGVMFEERRWARLFPPSVLAHLLRVSRTVGVEDYRTCPNARDMPVVMAVRMSLGFPFLISAVPMMIRDIGAEQRASARRDEAASRTDSTSTPAKGGRVYARLWFSDGGLTSNFPIHFFDAPLPTRPTFALSLDDLPRGEPPPAGRVSLQMKATEGLYLPIARIDTVADFALSLLGAAKDWQDSLLSGMPGQRERIVRVLLSGKEGGLNLDMPSDRSLQLMEYGREAGRRLKADFRFDEHRWRRGLVVYEQLERTVEATGAVWNGGYGTWISNYAQGSYPKNTGTNRRMMEGRMQLFAELAPAFTPTIRDKAGLFPKPIGKLRITPDV